MDAGYRTLACMLYADEMIGICEWYRRMYPSSQLLRIISSRAFGGVICLLQKLHEIYILITIFRNRTTLLKNRLPRRRYNFYAGANLQE